MSYPALEYKNLPNSNLINGILTIECNSLEEFEKIAKDLSEYKYYWRGQRTEQSLLPGIYRNSDTEEKTIDQHLSTFISALSKSKELNDFLEHQRDQKNRRQTSREALAVHVKMLLNSDKSDEENYLNLCNDIYWAIGQHHGLETPILDWTKAPYKALFFAFCKKKKDNKKRVVYGLAEKSRLVLKSQPERSRYVQFLDNLNFINKALQESGFDSMQMFDRIEAQEGLFTRTYKNRDIKSYARKCFDVYKRKKQKEIAFLIKIKIAEKLRHAVLNKLESKGMSYKTMYPDIQGAALHSNLKLEK